MAEVTEGLDNEGNMGLAVRGVGSGWNGADTGPKIADVAVGSGSVSPAGFAGGGGMTSLSGGKPAESEGGGPGGEDSGGAGPAGGGGYGEFASCGMVGDATKRTGV